MTKIKLNIVCAFIISILIFSSKSAVAVENYMDFISIEDEQELSHNTVKTVLQDKKGYMWFGTDDGLSKYDGYNTKKYRQTPFKENTLLDNYITVLEEDKVGNIWIGTNKGLTKLNPKKEIFTHYTNDKKEKNEITSNKISAIMKDKNGGLWVGTSDRGLNKYDENKDAFIPYDIDLSSKKITTIYEDHEGFLWIGTESGANRFNPSTKEVVKYNNDKNDPNTISGSYITSICQDLYGDIWIGTKSNGLNKLNLENKEIKRYSKDEDDSYSLGSNYITSIIEDKNGYLWIGTKYGGLARHERSKDYFVKRLSDYNSPKSNKQNNIETLYQDSTGLIWVGLEYGGVTKLNPLASFKNYMSEEVFENTMNDNNVLSLYKDNTGIIWVGTKNGGVNKLDLEERKVHFYNHNQNDKNTIGSNSVNHIIEDSEGMMWFGTEMGISILDKSTEKIIRHVHTQDEDSLISNNVNYMFEDSYKDIWIGTENGLDKYERDKGKFTHYNKKDSGLSGENITTIFEDNEKNIWIGTFHDGLNKYDRSSKVIKSYRNNPKDEKTISNDQIKSIVEDDEDNLWIGTSNGLNKFDKEKEAFTVFTESDQFKSNFISSILKSGNYLWISSNDGISKFDIQEQIVVKSYSTIDGLQGSYFNSGSAFKSEDGQLLFGGTDGFNTIYPDKENRGYYKPDIHLSRIMVNDKDVYIDSNKKIILPYNENRIYFEFGLIDYKKPYSNNHSFKLEGYEDEWNNVKNRNYGIYNNLKPGDYKLKIKGINSEGVETNKIVEVNITIKPPFWKTNLAYLLYVFIILVIIFLIFNYVELLEKIINERTNQLNKTNIKLLEEINHRKKTEEILKITIKENKKLFEDKMEIENVRNDFFINLSHELRTPLNIIISTIQLSEMYFRKEKSEVAISKVKEHFKIMRKNCYRLLKAVNNIIDVAKLESKQYELNMKLINIVYLIEDVITYTVEYARDKNISIIFDTETEEEIVKCDPVEIERVILNIISNAIKYGKNQGNVWVNIFKIEKSIKITIKDDGIGIPKNKHKMVFEKFKRISKDTKTGSGVGLSLSKLLIDMHGGTIELKSKEGNGSEFIITLPIYEMTNEEYSDVVDLEALDKEIMNLEIEMSEIK